MTPPHSLFAIMMLALVVGASCRQIVGIGSGSAAADAGGADAGAPTDDAAGEAGAPDGGLLVGGLSISGETAACAPCMMLKCLDEATACAATDGCPQLEACARSCAVGDVVCLQACGVWSDQSPAANAALGQCRLKWCESECLPGPWDCLGHVTWSEPPAPATIKIDATASDDVTGLPLDADVRVCSGDPPCASPLLEFPTTDGSGLLQVGQIPPSNTLHGNFFGYFDFRAPGYVTEIDATNVPIVRDFALSADLHPPDDWSATLGPTYDPTRAIVEVAVADCRGGVAKSGDVYFTFVNVDGQTNIESPPDDQVAFALAFNVPIDPKGKAMIEAHLRVTDQLIGVVYAPVRPGTFTIAVAWPSY